MSAHTPGPWRVAPISSVVGAIVFHIDGGMESVCSVFPHPDQRKTEANARLIASAPDLLCGLKDAVRMLRDCEEARGLVHVLLVIIATAEGGAL